MYTDKEKRKRSGGHELAFKMWTTKGARFCADQRCKKIAKLSTFTIAFLSFEIIAITIYSLYSGQEDPDSSKTITVFTLILSILFLVVSIFENAKGYNLQAHRYHSCSLEIGKIYTKLKIILAKNQDEDFNDYAILEEKEIQYEACLEKYENHEQIDYMSFKLIRKIDFEIDFWEAMIMRLTIYWNSKLMYHALIISGPIALTVFFLSK
jgi:hypothetical protein